MSTALTLAGGRSGRRPAEISQPTTDPGFALDMEEAVIGTCLAFSDAISACADLLRPEHFLSADLGLGWDVIQRMTLEGHRVDIHSFRDRINRDGLAEQARDQAYYVSLCLEAISAAHVRTYAERVIEGAASRRLLQAAIYIGERARAPGAAIERYSECLAELIQAEEQAFVGRKSGPAPIGNAAEELLAWRARIGTTGLAGRATGMANFDRVMGGLVPGELIIVAGRPGMGKTTFATNIIHYDAVAADGRPLFISGEMSSAQLLLRLAAAESRLGISAIRGQQLDRELEDRFMRALVRLGSYQDLLVDDRANPSIEQICASARSMHARKPLTLLVVDYMQIIRAEGHEGRRDEEITDIAKRLKGLARDLNIPVIALSQLNRGVEARQNKRPMMSDLKNSGGIEENADIIVFLYREAYYHKSENRTCEVSEAIFGKHRNGATQTVYQTFNGELGLFSDTAPGFRPPDPRGIDDF